MDANEARINVIGQLREIYADLLGDIYSKIDARSRLGESSLSYKLTNPKVDLTSVATGGEAQGAIEILKDRTRVAGLLPFSKVLESDGYAVEFADVRATMQFAIYTANLQNIEKLRALLADTESRSSSAADAAIRGAYEASQAAVRRLLAEAEAQRPQTPNELEILISW